MRSAATFSFTTGATQYRVQCSTATECAFPAAITVHPPTAKRQGDKATKFAICNFSGHAHEWRTYHHVRNPLWAIDSDLERGNQFPDARDSIFRDWGWENLGGIGEIVGVGETGENWRWWRN